MTSCFTAKVDVTLKDKIAEDLQNQGFKLEDAPYAFFAAKKKGIVCVFYTSGKFTVQGSDKDEFIEFYLEPEILKSFAYTHPEASVDMTPHIGVDESGKGDFFGPLCVVSVFADKNSIPLLIKIGTKDSKKISDSEIIKKANIIKKECPYAFLNLKPDKYNELYAKFKNLNFLLAWAHATVIDNLVKRTKCDRVIVDQFAYPHVLEKAIKQKKLTLNLTQKTHAEADIVVAAASIIARSFFLEGLEKISSEFNISIPKGASNLVVTTAQKLVAKHGEDILKKIAKLHFKTAKQI
jgi:ribonuclease HIII